MRSSPIYIKCNRTKQIRVLQQDAISYHPTARHLKLRGPISEFEMNGQNKNLIALQ